MTVYQGPASDFADHADALEQSCSDLIGVQPRPGSTACRSGRGRHGARLRAGREDDRGRGAAPPPDAVQLPAAALPEPAGPLRGRHDAGEHLPRHVRGGSRRRAGRSSHTSPSASFTPRDWEWVEHAAGRSGSAFFGVGSEHRRQCIAGIAIRRACCTSTARDIRLPSGVAAPRLTFDHWVATESGFDGGQLQISVSGGPWQLVAREHFTFNPYNSTLATAASRQHEPDGRPVRLHAAPTAARSTGAGADCT